MYKVILGLVSCSLISGFFWVKNMDNNSVSLNQILDASTQVEQVTTGYQFTEGPVWHPDHHLLFSDIPGDKIMQYQSGKPDRVFRQPSGKANGLTYDFHGRLISCEHQNRRVTRLERDGALTVIADQYEGKRLNSPNDVVVSSDGVIYFTDPPYGLDEQDNSPEKELDFNGVYMVRDGKITLLVRDLSRPNGLGLSPDERYLYVANSDPERKIWMRYGVNPDGTLDEGKVFYDASRVKKPGLPDGLKLDLDGNLYATGPGGVWIISPEGVHLGTMDFPEVATNCAWADDDARTLYVTAQKSVYRTRVMKHGLRPFAPALK
jgi:gluconolactonase